MTADQRLRRGRQVRHRQLSLLSGPGSGSEARRTHNDRNATAISLFASAGIGELGLKAAGFDILVANELLQYRADLYSENFPDTLMIGGDIWAVRDEVVGFTHELLAGRELDLVYATPPCQGMSTNGRGKLASEVHHGRRKEEDPRNRLVMPTVDIILDLRPRHVLFENVPGMQNTLIRNEDDEQELILDYISRRLAPEYSGTAAVVACEDFGIPQRRRRLLTIYSRDPAALEFFETNGASFIPDELRSPGATLREAIGHFPVLDARPDVNENREFHPQHRVPIMDERKYWWMDNTPEGDTAFNNQCVNPDCMFDGTPGHREEERDGKWVVVPDRPIVCDECGEALPRPTVIEKDGRIRSLKGFHSAYRRMRWDDTARTLTQNFIYEASDNKVHPSQNRVLSVYEAMVIQTISNYGYRFEIHGIDIGIPKIAGVIGESVPPLLIEKIARSLAAMSSHSVS